MKSKFNHQDRRCRPFGNTICAAIKNLPGPNLLPCFMKNWFHTSLYWSRTILKLILHYADFVKKRHCLLFLEHIFNFILHVFQKYVTLKVPILQYWTVCMISIFSHKSCKTIECWFYLWYAFSCCKSIRHLESGRI